MLQKIKFSPNLLMILALCFVAVFVSLTRPLTKDGFEFIAVSEIKSLPTWGFYSFLRMLAAYVISLGFASIFGLLAATSDLRAKVILPIIDILQSMPVLGFFPTAIFWFAGGGGENRMGLEAAAIFLIFTSMCWNLVFAIYEAIKSIPAESIEAAKSLGLGRFGLLRRVYLPCTLPRLIDNSILSWANGWYFLVACEIIVLGNLSFRLPGIGSFLATAIEASRFDHLAYGLAALCGFIFAIDFFIWRPLGELAKVYVFDGGQRDNPTKSIGFKLLAFYKNSPLMGWLQKSLRAVEQLLAQIEVILDQPEVKTNKKHRRWLRVSSYLLFWGLVIGFCIFLSYKTLLVVFSPWPLSAKDLFLALGASTFRLFVGYLLCVAIIVPLVFKLHRRPGGLENLRLYSQVIASVPATALFPLLIFVGLRIFHFDEAVSILLVITGMFWYLLFNVLGGAALIPSDLLEASDSMGLKGKLYWMKVFLPSIAPALVTGSITAIGGGWNSLFLSETFVFRQETHAVFGIGSLLSKATYQDGSQNQMTLILFVMVAFIVLMNNIFWQKLFRFVEKRFGGSGAY